MATYESICRVCGKEHTYSKPIAERNDAPVCCEVQTERAMITPPAGFVDTPAAG